MTERLRLLACQIAVPPTPDAGARDRHLARVAQAIDAALEAAAVDLVVLPELSAIDYARPSFERLEVLAEPLDGPSYLVFAELAARRGVTVVYGFPRRAGRGVCIALGVVGPDGALVGHYDKLHLAQFGASPEKDYFERGRHLLIFEVKGQRVAPMICYDIRFPELARALCVGQGATLLLHCGAYYRDESYASWPDFVVARAMENQAYVLSLNRAGAGWGGSLFCPPWVDESHPVARLFEDERLAVFEVDPACLARVRRDYALLRDARGDYARLPVQRPSAPAGGAPTD